MAVLQGLASHVCSDANVCVKKDEVCIKCLHAPVCAAGCRKCATTRATCFKCGEARCLDEDTEYDCAVDEYIKDQAPPCESPPCWNKGPTRRAAVPALTTAVAAKPSVFPIRGWLEEKRAWCCKNKKVGCIARCRADTDCGDKMVCKNAQCHPASAECRVCAQPRCAAGCEECEITVGSCTSCGSATCLDKKHDCDALIAKPRPTDVSAGTFLAILEGATQATKVARPGKGMPTVGSACSKGEQYVQTLVGCDGTKFTAAKCYCAAAAADSKLKGWQCKVVDRAPCGLEDEAREWCCAKKGIGCRKECAADVPCKFGYVCKGGRCTEQAECKVRSRKRAVNVFGWVFFLISSGSPHVRPMGVHRTWGEPVEIELTAMGVKLNGSRCRCARPATRRPSRRWRRTGRRRASSRGSRKAATSRAARAARAR